MTKMDLFKNALFVQNAYPILIVFLKKAIFGVFAEKVLNLVVFWTPLVY